MGQRIDLQHKLEEIIGSKNVYFQPPNNLTLQYPCIVYSLSDMHSKFADNGPYKLTNRYTVTYIDRKVEPVDDPVLKLAQMPLTTMDRRFYTDGLNHTTFVTYF